MGFQIYARDWKIPFQEGDEAATISVQDAINLAYEHMAEIYYDYVSVKSMLIMEQTPFKLR